MRYRADVDGLRALAVLAVVAYHVGLGGVAGGFTGVDVFFVLSGYLITGILWDDLATTGRIDWRSFYARRARRLLPALALTVAATLVIGIVVMVPDPELRWLSQSVIAVAGFASNVFFWLKTDGYFDAAAASQPLLHTWSLAVEEQFYLLWPLALGAAWRLSRRGRAQRNLAAAALTMLALASFALAATLPARSAAFYLMPTRLWELMAGASLAVAGSRLPRLAGRKAAGWAVVGAVLVLGPMVVAPPTRWFPGPATVPTVLGTMMLLTIGLTTPANRVSRLLATAPLVSIGKRSYSWYLIHWPLLVFVRVVTMTESVPRDLSIAAGSLVLAHAAHRWVEQPWRTGQTRWTRTTGRSLLSGLALIAVVGACGVAVLRTTDTVSLVELSQSESAALAENRSARDECPNLPTGAGEAVDCRFDADLPVRLVLVGDSHALAVLPAVRRAARELGWGLDVMWDTGCPFVVGYRAPAGNPSFDTPCVRENEVNSLYLLRNASSIGGVVTTSRASSFIGADADALTAWRVALTNTLSSLSDAGIPVALMHDVPHFELPVPQCVIRKGADSCGIEAGAAVAAREPVKQVEQSAIAEVGGTAAAWDPFGTLCTADRCEVVSGDLVLYRDGTHLSKAGALLLAHDLVPWLVAVFDPSH